MVDIAYQQNVDGLRGSIRQHIAIANERWASAEQALKVTNPKEMDYLDNAKPSGKWTSMFPRQR